MPYAIDGSCVDVMDGACAEVCPVDCIQLEEGADRKLYIDPEECIECGACEPVCPVSACFAADDATAAQAPFVAIDALWFRDRDEARARVNALKPPS